MEIREKVLCLSEQFYNHQEFSGWRLAEVGQLSRLGFKDACTFGFWAAAEVLKDLEVSILSASPLATDEAPLTTKDVWHQKRIVLQDMEAKIDQLNDLIMEFIQAPAHTQGPRPLNLKWRNSKMMQAQGSKKSVLILEEDALLAREISAHLNCFGWRVDMVHNQEQLVMALGMSSFSFDAIIAGVAFHGECLGPGIVKSALAQGGKNLPVIYISSKQDMATRLTAIRSNGIAYLQKPIDPDKLAQILESAINPIVEKDPFRILVIDGEDQLGAIYKDALILAGHSVKLITNPLETLMALTEFPAELIVLDQHSKEASGAELIQLLRQQPSYAGIQIVLLSQSLDRVETIRMGADDCYDKTTPIDHLVKLIGARARRCREIQSYMVCDGLTGLLNHERLKEALNQETARALRTKCHFSFAMIDIDWFKTVNDEYGHSTGDYILQTLARLLRKRLRKTDILGRYGGEEFAIILPDTPKQGAHKILDILRQEFQEIKHSCRGVEFSVTMSIGISNSEQFSSAEEINESADAYLYAAKSAGRNTVRSE